MHTCILVADDRDIYILLEQYIVNECSDEPQLSTAKFDYLGIGGRFEGALELKHPKQLRKFFGLFPAGTTQNVSVAKKQEVNQQRLISNPPVALFFDGKLYEAPLFANGKELTDWQNQFKSVFESIPDHTTLQIVDAHS